jgi:hypothetical protein
MLMVNTPPQERPPPPPVATSAAPQQTYDYGGNEHNSLFETDFGSNPVRTSDEMRRPSLLPAATAAAALASLHNHRAEYDWDSDPVRSRSAAPLHKTELTAAVNRTRHPTQTRRTIDLARDSLLPP